MNQKTQRILTGLFLLAAGPALLLAHPHFQRKSSVAVSQDQSIELQHVTLPYNEANPDKLEVGKSWSIFGAKLSTPVNLKSGSTKIPAGDYGIQILKDSASSYSMALTKGDDKMKLESKFKDGLGNQDHLAIDIHMRGGGDDLAGYIDLRFGTFMVAGKINIDHDASQ